MKYFKGKIIKLTLNSQSGWISVTGPFIDCEDDFLIIKNSFSNKIEYVSKYCIKNVEIIRDVEPSDLEVLENDNHAE